MILLENIRYIEWETFEITEGNMLIEEGADKSIRFLNPEQIAQLPNDCQRIQSKGKFAIKSFVNAHHHAYSALAPGMPQPKEAPKNFLEILQKIWWKLDKALTKDMIEISAATTAISSAKNGVSFIIDHHASPFALSGSLNIMANQFEKIGLNHLLCYEISDRDGEAIRDEGLAETENYLQNHQGLVGLHAAFTLSDDSLIKAQIITEKYNSGVHIHVAEDAYDQQYNLEKHGKRVVDRLSYFGLLDFDKSILAHCIHIDENERKRIAASKAWVVQNPESNLNNQVGFFNSNLLESKTMLGTDGMHSNMIRSAQSTFFTGLGKDSIDIPKAYNRLRNAHQYLSANNFKGDGENNISIFDYNAPTPLTQSNFPGHFFYAFENRQIDSLIVNGKFVMKDKKMLNIDEDLIMKEARKLAEILWKKME
jgi:cytosine/adenosine deaminase-related metal-dependent hydrolase